MRRRAFAAGAAVVAVALITGGGAGTSATPAPARAAVVQGDKVPPELLKDLVELDRRITDLILDITSGTVSGQAAADEIQKLVDLKWELVKKHFPQSFHNYRYYDLAQYLDSIDSSLARAALLAHAGDDEAALKALERAKEIKQALENDLRERGRSLPEGLIKAIVALDRKFADVIARARSGALSGKDLEKAIDGLEQAKLLLVEKYFPNQIYGIPFWNLFWALNRIDRNFERASEAIKAGETTLAVFHLNYAKKYKEDLQHDYAAVATHCARPQIGAPEHAAATGRAGTVHVKVSLRCGRRYAAGRAIRFFAVTGRERRARGAVVSLARPIAVTVQVGPRAKRLLLLFPGERGMRGDSHSIKLVHR